MTYLKTDFSDLSHIKLLGKTYPESGALPLAWSYSGFSFGFNGTGFILRFADTRNEQPVYLRVTVDGAGSRVAVLDGREAVVYDGFPEGAHTATVMRVTEGLEALVCTELMLCGESPAFGEKPADADKLIFFIGDSITCGYGVCAPADTSEFNLFEEDCTRSYAYETAKLLGADVFFTGASGKGIVANCMGNREDMTLPQAFEWLDRKGGEWEHGRVKPDIIVINAGTNDAWGGVSDEEWRPAAVAFMRRLRGCYPDAPILWAYGIMDVTKQKTAGEAVSEFGSECGNAYFMPIDCMYSFTGEVGGVGHPNTVTSKRVAPLLAEKIRSLLK